ncbi:MAG: TolC family protein [Planctomycetes bacterium]|nr:TolC family protein [Planctomycetota bacterium]
MLQKFFTISLTSLALTGCVSYQPWPLEAAEELNHWPEAQRQIAEAHGLNLSDGLSFFEAQTLGVWFNPELVLKRAEAGIERANADNAGLWEDPSLRLDGSKLLESADKPWSAALGIGLTIPIFGRLGLEKQVAEHRLNQAQLEVLAAEWSLQIELWQRWLTFDALRDRIAYHERYLELAEPLLARAKLLQEAGQIPNTEERHLRIRQALTEAQLATLKAELAMLENRILALVGIAPESEVRLDRASPPLPNPVAKEGWQYTLLRQSAALAIKRAAYRASESQLELEVRKQWPDLELSPFFESDQGENSLGLGVSLRLPIWNRNQGRIAEAEASRAAAREAFVATLKQELWLLHQQEQQEFETSKRAEGIERQILPLVEEQILDLSRLAELGQLDVMLVAETLEERLDAQLALRKAREEAQQARLAQVATLGPAHKETTESKEQR